MNSTLVTMYKNGEIYTGNKKTHVAIPIEDIDIISSAILAGKYSLSAALVLEALKQNPMDYIPYRTYSRIIKSKKQHIAEVHEVKKVNKG